MVKAWQKQKRWRKSGENTEELYRNGLNDPDNRDHVITYVEPGILQCEVKWALGNITTNKASGGDRIPVELFHVLKDDAVKVLPSICQQIWKIQQWPQDWKRSIFIPVPKKGNAKDYSNYQTVVLISHASKVMLKILQARLQQYINWELTDVLFSSVQSLSCVRLFATPWIAAHEASQSITNSRSPPKPMSIESVMPSSHLILCRSFLLLPSIFLSIRVFSNESALCIRWPSVGVSASTSVLPVNKLGLKKAEEPEIKLPASIGS